MEKKLSKKDRVLEYLKTHDEGITSLEAINMFGATRLSDIIFRLKKEGYIFKTESVSVKDRYDTKVTVARYKLIG